MLASLQVADRGYVLETGRVVLQGQSLELLRNRDVVENAGTVIRQILFAGKHAGGMKQRHLIFQAADRHVDFIAVHGRVERAVERHHQRERDQGKNKQGHDDFEQHHALAGPGRAPVTMNPVHGR